MTKLLKAAERKFKSLNGLYLIKPEMKEAVVTIFLAGAAYAREEILGLLRSEGFLDEHDPYDCTVHNIITWIEQELKK